MPESIIAQNALVCPFSPIPGMALAVPESAGSNKRLILCCEISDPPLRSVLSSAADKLSCCVCGRLNLPYIGLSSKYRETSDLCVRSSALPLLAVSNMGSDGNFSGALAHEALKSHDSRRALASELISVAEESGFMGLYIEFCRLFPFDTEIFLDFIKILSSEAHKSGFFLISSLETEAAAANPFLCEVLNKFCDFIVLLSFDYPVYSPSPALPLNLLRRDLELLRRLTAPGKYLISFSDRALDFTLPEREIKSMSSSRALKLALSAADSINYNFLSASASFNYRSPCGKSHRVFTPDVRTAEAICALIEEYGLSGVFFRQSECPEGPEFNYICSQISAKKYI